MCPIASYKLMIVMSLFGNIENCLLYSLSHKSSTFLLMDNITKMGKMRFLNIFFKKRKNDLIHPRMKFHIIVLLKYIFCE